MYAAADSGHGHVGQVEREACWPVGTVRWWWCCVVAVAVAVAVACARVSVQVCVRGAPGTAGPSCGLVRGVMSPLMTCPIDPMASSAASAEPEPCRRWWSRGGSPPPPQPPAAGSICSAPILRNVEAPVRCAWATPSCWLLHCLSWLQIQAGRRCGRPACRRHAQDERVLRRLPLHEGRHGRAHMHGCGTNIHCRRGISTKFLSCKSLSITNGNA